MQNILVFPRNVIDGVNGFVRWSESEKLISSAANAVAWIPRLDAECSETWVQPIPCAIFRDSLGRYCVFRQIKQPRQDLSNRLSFVVGGHIDHSYNPDDLGESICQTIKREIFEEVGLSVDEVDKPVGIVVDGSSLMASRHVGIVYEIEVATDLRPKSDQEFSVRSKFNGMFLTVMDRSRLQDKFDPWSSIISAQYMEVGNSTDLGHQPTLLTQDNK